MKHRKAPLMLPLLAACGVGGADLGVVVRDSAGVEIVEMSGAFATDAPELTLLEDLRIGALDGAPELEFARILHLAEGDDGSIFVADGGNHVVRKFSPDGEFLLEFGSEGEGPGRFTGPWNIAFAGDSTVVVDRYIQYFDSTGTLIDAVAPDLAQRNSSVWELDVTDAGWLIKTRSTFSDDMRQAGVGANPDATGPFADTTYVEQFDPASGARGTTIFAYPLETWYRMHAAFHVVPFLGPTPYHDVSADGRIHLARGGRYEIETWAPLDAIERPGMTLARRISAAVSLLPRTKKLEEMHLEVQRERFGNRPTGGEMDIWRQIQMEDVLELDGPDHRPVLGRLFVSPAGELLVERLDLDQNPFRADEPTVWDLIGEDGRIRGRLTSSARFRPMALTSNGLLGVLRDEFDVQYVARYRIGRRDR